MDCIEHFRGPYWFLSNFYPHPIVGSRGLRYPTAEAAFHAGKTNDRRWRARIAAASTPSEAKRLGRKVPLISGWDEHRHVVMRYVLATKFSDPELATRLLATSGAKLVETNGWHDNYWGNCRCSRSTCAKPGANWLGKHLMQLRDELTHRGNPNLI